ncbi:hypothetical protein SUGI_0887970 [Cryptomeria japonica]|nr:hypothetical protein SUGI_0887970 [Cryptomeria japonica]
MERNSHHPIPTKTGFRRFTAILSQNNIQDEDIYSIDDEFLDFVPNTQIMNATNISNCPPFSERENEDVFSYTPSEKQSNVHDKTHTAPPPQKGRTRWSISDTIILLEAKRIEKDMLSNAGLMKKATTSTKKWKIVQEYCFQHGVFRTAN